MKNLILISFLLFCLFFDIKCYYIPCSRETDGHPSSKYHCSGLNITNDGDTHCCYWTFYDEVNNKNISRCSSISQKQYNKLHEYIYNKTVNYSNLDIQCAGDQKLYCSNILFDQEPIDNCRKLPVSDSKDSYCCRWRFKDNTNNGKMNNYCASLSQYQYETIDDYIDYKEDNGRGRYDDLSIECLEYFIKSNAELYILLFILLLF